MTVEAETRESPLSCSKCGKVALWRRVQVPAYFPKRLRPIVPTETLQLDPDDKVVWLLNIPCECGSQLFNIRVDHPRSHTQLFGVTT